MMRRLFGTLGGVLLALGAMVSSGAVAAEGRTPVGIWTTETKDSHWEITACGERGAICAQLVWIAPERYNGTRETYIGTYLFQNLPLTGSYRWTGPVTLNGKTFDSKLTQTSDDEIRVEACILILCDGTSITRVAQPAE